MKLSIVLAFGACFGRLHLTSNSNLVVYWGQNSYGHTHLRSPTDWEKPLRHYCEDESISTLIISFLYKLRAGSGRLPILNLSKHCVTHFEAPNHDLLKCPEVEQDIKYCQQRGKTILLSIGGDVGLTNIPTPAAADQLAIDIWNLYLGGHSDYRPFGSAKLDGIDLDIEGGSQANYPQFLAKLRSHFGYWKYYITAAPQCEYPDRNLQTILDTTYIDALFIQFYNNWCGVQNYNNPWAWSWGKWETWAANKSKNSNVKIFLGIPASKTAAGSGYLPPHMINNIVNDINVSPHFGGVMLWDASQNMHNTFDGYEFGKVVYSALNTSFLRNHPINLNPSYGKTAAAKSIPTHNQHTYGGTKSIYSSNQPTHHLSKPIPYNQVRVATKRIFDDQAHEVTNLTSPYQHTRAIANPHNQRTYGLSKPISYNQVDLAAKPIPHNQTHEVIKSISPYRQAYGILQPISPHKQQPHYQTKPIFSYDQVYEATKPLAHKVTMKPISKDYTQAATTKPPTAPYTVRPTHAITYPFNLIDPTQRKPIKVKYPDTASDPDPNPSCPVHGEPCNKLHACAGDQFATCDQGRWVLRPCGSNLVCGMAGDIVLCDLPNPRPN